MGNRWIRWDTCRPDRDIRRLLLLAAIAVWMMGDLNLFVIWCFGQSDESSGAEC